MPLIGRLHRIETQNEEFASFKIRDRVQLKVLKVTEGKCALIIISIVNKMFCKYR